MVPNYCSVFLPQKKTLIKLIEYILLENLFSNEASLVHTTS